MFPRRYLPARYFSPRYWPPVSSSPVPVVVPRVLVLVLRSQSSEWVGLIVSSRVELLLSILPIEEIDLRHESIVEITLDPMSRVDVFLISDPIIYFVMEG